MKKNEVVQLLMRVKAEFPYSFTADTEEMLELRMQNWYECLKDYSNEQVMDGFKIALMKIDKPPTIADLVSFIQKAERLNQPSDNEFWSILLNGVNEIKNKLVQETPSSMWRKPIYQLKDKSLCAIVYEALPLEIRKTIDFQTFILFACLDEKSLSIERNRFLKAILEVRTAISEKKMVGENNFVANGSKRLNSRNEKALNAGGQNKWIK